ncbi:MAG: ATP-binding protein [Hyphomicrobium sp.]
MKLNSLAARLFLSSAMWALLILPFVGYRIYTNYSQGVQLSSDKRLESLVTAISFDSMDTKGDEPVTPKNLYEPMFEETLSGWYWQIRPLDGAPGRTLVSPSLASSLLPSPYEKKFPADEASGLRWSNITGPNGVPIRTIEAIDTPGHDPNKTKYSVIVASPMDWVEEPVSNFRRWLITQLLWVSLLLLGLMLVQVRLALGPMRQVEQALSRIRSGDATRLEGRLPAEIEPLQTELNALIESNQEIVDRARTQVGNLAHALKTPLAVITNEAREDPTPFALKVAEQAQIMRDQINHYLDRARIAARASVIGRVTPVEATAEPLIRALERIYRDKGVEIDMQAPPDAKFQGEKQDLEEMLGNLLDNACKWSRRAVTLKVFVEGGEGRGRPKRLRIEVDDDGPGLSEGERGRIGKRGQRLDETKPGSGLGLSIVSDLAASYRGALTFVASPKGGLGARLDLPAA